MANDLRTLLMNDYDLRAFFVTLPVRVQMTLHQENDNIKSAEELHKYVDFLTKTNCRTL
ncbi:MAG TPA: hypothetical protein VHO94_02360 [Oscillospiraceae bacterium]|nr:hypothetical protein [Oscillospiraceae bacterium]